MEQKFIFKLSNENLKVLRELLAIMRGKFIFLFCLFALCLPVFADTMKGSVSYTEENARQEAFEGIKKLDILYSVGWENKKYFLKNVKNEDILYIGKTKAKIAFLTIGSSTSVIYKDEPQKEYIYINYYGKKIVYATTTQINNASGIQKYITYDRYGHLLNIQLIIYNDSFIFDKDGKLLSHWQNNQGKIIKYPNIKLQENIIYSLQ